MNKEKLISYSFYYAGEYDRIIKAINNNEDVVMTNIDNAITIFDVEYGLRAKIILQMQDKQKADAEAWLTEALNKKIELELEFSEYAEVPVE